MKKLILLSLILSLTSCATYTPIVDSVGRSGTFNEIKADRITDDIILCTSLADKHITTSMEIQNFVILNILRPASLGVVSVPEDTKKNYIRKCLHNRGDSLIN